MRAYGRKRSSGFRASSKKQNGHCSEEGRGDRGDGRGESGASCSDLMSFPSRCRAASVAAVDSTLFQLNGFRR
jgi:hypothetical protein